MDYFRQSFSSSLHHPGVCVPAVMSFFFYRDHFLHRYVFHESSPAAGLTVRLSVPNLTIPEEKKKSFLVK
jgi:hypothetical protein